MTDRIQKYCSFFIYIGRRTCNLAYEHRKTWPYGTKNCRCKCSKKLKSFNSGYQSCMFDFLSTTYFQVSYGFIETLNSEGRKCECALNSRPTSESFLQSKLNAFLRSSKSLKSSLHGHQAACRIEMLLSVHLTAFRDEVIVRLYFRSGIPV